MRIATRFNTRITQVAVGRHLPHRTVRVRLTLLYGGLFLLSGAALMAITYVVLGHAGRALTQAGTLLAGMSLLSLGLGWLMAGRVLQPLEDAYKAQRQFVANAAHELRAPLTRLRALSEIALASSEANVASLRKAHERVLASEQHLEQLIDALLALTRGQAGLEHRQQLDLAMLTAQAIGARESQLAELDLDVRANLDAARTSGDPRLIERLIANLIDNAIRHNTPGGQLEITTATRDRHPYLAVSNTGAAIPSEEIQRLFLPFQRLDGARIQHNSGHGLGLSIVQAISTAHHAELTASARAEGGLTVEISFSAPTRAGSRLKLATARTKRARAATLQD